MSKLNTLFLTATLIIAVVACNPKGQKGDTGTNDSTKVMSMKEKLSQHLIYAKIASQSN